MSHHRLPLVVVSTVLMLLVLGPCVAVPLRAQPTAGSGAEPDDPHAGHAAQPPSGTPQDDPHAGHTPPGTPPPADPHAGHVMPDGSQELPPFIPRLTDEDRRAAFPDVAGHAAHDRLLNYFVLFDHVEWQDAASGRSLSVDTTGWVGGDRNRLWFRAGGDRESGGSGAASVQALYGRQVARWWDLVAGIRQDIRPGPAQTWAAVGVQGLAPYWFEFEATAYVSTSGQVQARLEADYDLRVTNRLIVQPQAVLRLSGTSDADRQVEPGLSDTDLGFRVRYLIRRELAPYAGVTWTRRYGAAAAHARSHGEAVGGPRVVAGLRMWF